MKLTASISALVGLALLSACGSNNSSGTSADSATAVADSTNKTVQPTNAADQDFVNYAVSANTKEIIWLEAGIKQGHSKQLKENARMMLKDHKKLDSTVSAYLSDHKSVGVPVVDTANTVNINDKKGADWDKAFAKKMVDDHSDLLQKLQNSQSAVKDTSLLAIINGTIPVVQSHLDMAKKLQSIIK